MRFSLKKIKLPRWLLVIGVIAAILLIAFLVLKLSGTFDELAATYVDRGDRLVAEGAYSEAAQEYAYALTLKDLDGQSAYQAYLKRAEIFQRKRNYSAAIEELTAATKLRSRQRDAWLMLGQVLLSARRTPEAVTALEKARTLDRQHPNTLQLLGLSYFRQGQFGQAQDLLRQAVAAEPENQAGYYYLTLVFLNQNLEESEKMIAESLRREGAFSAGAKQLQNRIGELKRRTGQSEGTMAVDAYQKILRGWIYAEVGESEMARCLAIEALAVVDDYRDAWILKGFSEIELKDFLEAKQSLARATQIDPTYGQVAYLQARTEAALGDIDAAEILYQKALALGYRQYQVYLDYAQLLMSRANYSEAEKPLRAAYKIDPREISGGCRLVYLLGKHLDKAPEGLEIALELDRYWQTGQTHSLVALGYALAGDGTAALNFADQALSHDSLDPLAYFVRGLVREDQAELEKAIDRDFDGQVAEWARERITNNK